MREQYNVKSIDQALSIFLNLIVNNTLSMKDNAELVECYRMDSDVRDIISDIIEPRANITILNSQDTLYLSPNTDNRYFGYTNEQLRDKFAFGNMKKTNEVIYTSYFVILSLLALFYSEDSLEDVGRSYTTFPEIETFISTKLAMFESMESLDEVEAECKFNLSSCISFWNDLEIFNERQEISNSPKTKLGFVYKVCKFLKDEGLARIDDNDREVTLTEKTFNMVNRYYTDKMRRDRIMSILCKKGEE